jgi:hypothetical protein
MSALRSPLADLASDSRETTPLRGRREEVQRTMRTTVACTLPLSCSALLFIILAMVSPNDTSGCASEQINCGWSTVQKEGVRIAYPADGEGWYVNASLTVSIGLFESCYTGFRTKSFRIDGLAALQPPAPQPRASEAMSGVRRVLSDAVSHQVWRAAGEAPVNPDPGARAENETTEVNTCGGVNEPTFGPPVVHIEDFLELVQVTKTLMILGALATAASAALSASVAFFVPSSIGATGSLLQTLHTCILLATLFACA